MPTGCLLRATASQILKDGGGGGGWGVADMWPHGMTQATLMERNRQRCGFASVRDVQSGADLKLPGLRGVKGGGGGVFAMCV